MVKLLRYFFANVLMRLCGFIRGLLCFLQFIVCGSWCLYAFVELRIASAFSLWVLSFCDMFYDTFCSFHLCFFDAIHVRCVCEMWFRGLLDLLTGGLRFECSELLCSYSEEFFSCFCCRLACLFVFMFVYPFLFFLI